MGDKLNGKLSKVLNLERIDECNEVAWNWYNIEGIRTNYVVTSIKGH